MGNADPGAVDDHVEPAEPRKHRRDHGFPVVLVRDVVLDEERLAASVCDLPGRALAIGDVQVRDGQLGALLGEPDRAHTPDARGGAGDDGDLARSPAAHWAIIPPSITSSAPVMKLDSSDAR